MTAHSAMRRFFTDPLIPPIALILLASPVVLATGRVPGGHETSSNPRIAGGDDVKVLEEF